MLTACGGFPHPGDDGIRQACARLTKEEKEEHTCRSKEGTLRAAFGKRLHAFCEHFVPSFNAYIVYVHRRPQEAARTRSKGSAFAYDVSPQPQPSIVRDEAHYDRLAAKRQAGREREAALGGKTPSNTSATPQPYHLSMSDPALLRYKGVFHGARGRDGHGGRDLGCGTPRRDVPPQPARQRRT